MKNLIKVLLIACVVCSGSSQANELKRQVAAKMDIFTVGVSETEITVLYPDRIDILNPDGEVELFSELNRNQRGILSENGKYIGILTFEEGVGEYMVISGFEFYESSGRPIFKIEKDYHTTYHLANNGQVISVLRDVNSPDFARMYFYRDDGTPFANTELNGLETFDFSPDGHYLLANTQNRGLIAFNTETGEEEWSVKEKGQYFATSNNAEFTATVNKDTLRFYYRDQELGREMLEKPFPRDIAMSSDGKYVLVADRWTLYAYQLAKEKKPKQLWKVGPYQQEDTFVSVAINSDGTRFLAGIDHDSGGNAPVNERHTRGLIRGFDQEGNRILDEEVRYNMWHYRTPRVGFLPNSTDTGFVQTRRELYRLKLEEEAASEE